MNLSKIPRHYFELSNKSISQQDLMNLFPTILNQHLIVLIIDYWSSWILDYLVEYNYPSTNIKSDENVDSDFCNDMIDYELFENSHNITVQDKKNVESLIAVSDDINCVEIEIHNIPLCHIYPYKDTQEFIKNNYPKTNVKAITLLSKCNNELSVISISKCFWTICPFDWFDDYILYTKIGDKVIMYTAENENQRR